MNFTPGIYSDAFRLDWMHEAEQDLTDSSAYLTALIKELKPDLLHLNQLCYGNLPVDIPRVVVAHGDLISWWKEVHDTSRRRSLDALVSNAMMRGLWQADACRHRVDADAIRDL